MVFKLFTIEEMIKDILGFEDVTVTFPVTNMLFTKVYSQLFDKPAEGDNRNEEIQNRIKMILTGKFGNLITKVDKDPEAEDSITIYINEGRIDWYDDSKPAKYYKGYKDRKVAEEEFSVLNENAAFVLDHENKIVLFFLKDIPAQGTGL